MIKFLNERHERFDVANYDGSLKAKTLVDWIEEIEQYFKYEKAKDPPREKASATKLKGHTTL